MAITSYAQNFEDVMLARCFPGPRGFYVDVGANDPDVDSVTRAFYERGWSGINIEPIAVKFHRLRERRRRDVNLPIAAGDREGTVVFYEIGKWHGFSTTDAGIAARHRKDGLKVVERRVPLRRLAAVLDEHARGRTVDFLSIDVEGAELSVLKGAELARHRPKVIVAESRLPVSLAMVDRPDEVPDRAGEFARFLEPLRYRPAYHDGLNVFFLADEHRALARHFSRPPGIFDRLIHAASIRPLETKIARLRAELSALRAGRRKKGREPAVAPRKGKSGKARRAK
jgi:FkbM family methyltransferase